MVGEKPLQLTKEPHRDLLEGEERRPPRDPKGKNKSNMKRRMARLELVKSSTEPFTIESAKVKPPITLIHSP